MFHRRYSLHFIGGYKLNTIKVQTAKAVNLIDTQHAYRLNIELLQVNPLKVGEASTFIDPPCMIMSVVYIPARIIL